jgi:hypothetical protein
MKRGDFTPTRSCAPGSCPQFHSDLRGQCSPPARRTETLTPQPPSACTARPPCPGLRSPACRAPASTRAPRPGHRVPASANPPVVPQPPLAHTARPPPDSDAPASDLPPPCHDSDAPTGARPPPRPDAVSCSSSMPGCRPTGELYDFDLVSHSSL